MPSCTPASTTTSHSKPFAACAVSRRTASPRSALGAIVSAGRSWPSTWSRNTPTPAPGSRSTNRAAASKSTTMASRSRSAASARHCRARPACAGSVTRMLPVLIAYHRSARPLARQTVHSTSSAEAPGSAAAARATMSRRAMVCAGRAQRRSTRSSPAGSRIASTSSSPEGRRSPAATASARRPCRNRRSASGSAPPSGECSSATAASSSSSSGSSAPRKSSRNGATAGCRCSGRSSAWITVGTPEAASARCTDGCWSVADRITTAIRDQGTP